MSLDDSSQANLDKLVQVGRQMLEEPVSERDVETGELVAIPTGETNREALKRYVFSSVILQNTLTILYTS